MADPISISSSLVGAIGLAIQTCQGALKYYKSYKSAAADISQMREELESVTVTLKILERSTRSRHVSLNTKTEVERHIKRTLEGVDELRRKLEDVWTNEPEAISQAATEAKGTSTRAGKPDTMIRRFGECTMRSFDRNMHRVHRTIDRTKYPFREETILKLRNVVDKVKADLMLALQIMLNDAADGTLGGIETLIDSLGRVHSSLGRNYDQLNITTGRLYDDLDCLRREMECRDEQSSDNANQIGQLRIQANGLQEDIEEVHIEIAKTTEWLLESVLDVRVQVNTRTDLIRGDVNRVHEQLMLRSEQLIGEIRSIEPSLMTNIDRIADEINGWLEITTHNTNETREAVRELNGEMVSVNKAVSYIEQRHQVQEHDSFFEWLSPLTTDFGNKHSDIYNTRCKQEGAGDQFLKSEPYLRWLEGFGGTLWCIGGPGVGKTILTSSVVESLQQKRSQNEGLAFIYCEYSETRKHDPSKYAIKLLGNIARQLASDQQIAEGELGQLYRRYLRSKIYPTRAECCEAISTTVARHSKVYLIIDALDECPKVTRDDVFKEIRRLDTKIRILVTSRCRFAKLYDSQRDREVKIRALDDDIAEYVKASTTNFEDFTADITNDIQFQQRIVKGVVERAKGMFLLAKLHVQSLLWKPDDYTLEAALNALPDKLGPTYDEIINRIEERDPELAAKAKKLITWIIFAERPLRVEEIQFALAIEPGDASLDLKKVPRRPAVFSYCPDLVELQRNGTLGLVHYSAQEHFARRYISGQSLIALSCLAHLSFEPFGNGPCRDFSSFRSRLFLNPLLGYACDNWGIHAQCTTNADVREETSKFIRRPLNVLSCIEVLSRSDNFVISADKVSSLPQDYLGLYMAAYYGWYDLASELLDGRIAVNLAEERVSSRHPLALALKRNHQKIVLLFLDHGTSVNACDLGDRTALHFAAELGDLDFARQLLDRGANVRAKTVPHRQTALHISAKNQNTDMMRLLLSFSHDNHLVRAEDVNGNTALHHAASFAGTAAVTMLLRRGADVNAKTKQGKVPLRCVLLGLPNLRSERHIVMRLLIDHGANVNARDQSGQTALHLAADRADVEVLERLLDHGACIDDVDVLGRSALWFATSVGHVRGGYFEAISFLLGRGARVNIEDNRKPPLMQALQANDSRILGVLLSYGAEVNRPTIQGSTALIELIKSRYEPSLRKIELLLEAWADPNIRDCDGCTALYYAKKTSQKAECAQLLLEYGAKDTDTRIGLYADTKPRQSKKDR